MGLDVTFTIGADGTAEMNTNGDVDQPPLRHAGRRARGGRRWSSRCRDALLTVSDGRRDDDAEPREAGSVERGRPESSTRAPRLRISGASGRSRASRADGLHAARLETADMAGDTLVIYGDYLRPDPAGHDAGRPVRAAWTTSRCSCSVLDGEICRSRCARTERSAIEMSDAHTVVRAYRRRARSGRRTNCGIQSAQARPNPPPGARESCSEKKYVMTDADVKRLQHDRRAAGRIMSIPFCFHEDGTVKLVIAGADIPGLTWVLWQSAHGSGRGRTAW